MVGRASLHITHGKNLGERGAVVDEMCRSASPERSAYWARKNPSIVLEDEHLNENWVRTVDGEWVEPRSVAEAQRHVQEYGRSRADRVAGGIREDVWNERKQKATGGTVTTSYLVAHLPRTLCKEVPNVYPVLDDKGNPVLDDDGKPVRRSRWVARDPDEARRYFEDVEEFLVEHQIPGGRDALLARSIQHSESTPHAQWAFDTFADHPTKDGFLRADASRAWFSHRDVRDEDGKAMSGPAKLRRLHENLKAHMRERGWDVELTIDAEREGVGQDKAAYERTQDALRKAEAQAEKSEALRAVAKRDGDAAFEDRRAARKERTQAEEEAVSIRRKARDEGRKEGYAAGLAAGAKEVRENLAEDLRAAQDARAAAEAQRAALARLAEDLEDELETARSLVGLAGAVRLKSGKTVAERVKEHEATALRAQRLLDDTSPLDLPSSSSRREFEAGG